MREVRRLALGDAGRRVALRGEGATGDVNMEVHQSRCAQAVFIA